MKQSGAFVEKPQTRSMIVYYAISLAIAALSVLGAIIAYALSPQFIDIDFRLPLLGVLIGVLLLVVFGYLHLEMLITNYLISATDAQARWGLLIRREETVQLGSVRAIEIRQELIQRLFNLGDVILYTTSNNLLVLKDLDRPAEKKNLIWNLVQQEAVRRQPQSNRDR